MPDRVLIVDDDVAMCEVLSETLGARGFDVVFSTSGESAMARLDQMEFATVVTDVCMPGVNGIDLCRRITGKYPQIPVIVITAFGKLETAIDAIRAGAYDFITKPLESESLALTLQRAIDLRNLRDEVKRLRYALNYDVQLPTIVGDCPDMQKLRATIARISESDVSVLISGESGSGKEMIARALHSAGRRAGGPFVAVDCTRLPESALEAELFGHFADRSTEAECRGVFAQAHGGTVFLDEVGRMPLSTQARLLRMIRQETGPTGGVRESHFDVRLMASTNRDLESAVSEGEFRDDLYFQINVVHLEVPPLRARGNDVLLLAQYLLREFGQKARTPVVGLSPAAAQKLLAYPWPGNIRELRNCVERAVALASCDHLMVEDLPDKVRNYEPSHVLLAAENPSELVTMDEVERRYIHRVLEAVGGNKTLAARVLGFDRKTLYRKLESFAVLERINAGKPS